MSMASYARSHYDTLVMPTESAYNCRPILVYVPDSSTFDPKEPLPVLYLLHGVNGDQKSWSRDGNLMQILDTLIAKEHIRPVLVVMPNGSVGPFLWNKEDKSLFRILMGYHKLRHGNFSYFFYEIEHYIDSCYNLSPHSADHAIAGLSNGALQAAEIVQKNPNYFDFVGLFSPVVSKREVPYCESCSYYWVGLGKTDILAPNAKRFSRRLKDKNIAHTYYESKHSHNWRAWQEHLIQFVKECFPK